MTTPSHPTIPRSLSFALSQEELFVAMLHLQLEQFPGLDMEVFKPLNKEQLSLLIGVTERALLARNFLKPGQDGTLQLEMLLRGVLLACLFPDTSLLVRHTRPDAAAEEYFFHSYRKMFILHSIPISGIHQFIAVEDKQAIPRAVFSLLSLPDRPHPAFEAGTTRLSLFEQARDVALERGIEAAMQVLSQDGLTEALAQELAVTLSDPIANTTFVYIAHKNSNLAQGFTILQGKNALWWIEPAGEDEQDRISISSLSSEEIIRRLRELLRYST